MNKSLSMWITFFAILIVLLALDLGFFNKKDHEIGVKESLLLSAFYIIIGLLFSIWIFYKIGMQSSTEYITGYLVEKSLSLDNIFVISLVFNYLGIPKLLQHRVLFWGIVGVIVLRGIMIGMGATLVSEFSWLLYIFAVFLIFTGVKIFTAKEHKTDISTNKLLLFIQSHLKVTKKLHGNHFFVTIEDVTTKKKSIWCTPLFVALLMVEGVDAIFAIDSVPAIFAITTDTYVIYTSNIFAILGLRALYFALAAILPRFIYLKYALSIILIFIGSKIFIADIFGWNKFPASISLGVTVGVLAFGILCSLYKTRKIDYNREQ